MTNRLSNFRKAKHLSLEAVAKVLGIEPSLLKKIENNVCEMEADKYKVIAEYFDIRVEYLMGHSYKLQKPIREWRKDQQEDYNNASEDCEKEYLAMKYGNPIFEH